MPEEAVVRPFGDTGRSTETSPDTKVLFVVQTAPSRAVDEGLKTANFQGVMEQAVHKCVVGPHRVEAVATLVIDASDFIVPLVKFVKQNVEKSSLEKAKMEKYRNISNKAVIDQDPGQKTSSLQSKRT